MHEPEPDLILKGQYPGMSYPVYVDLAAMSDAKPQKRRTKRRHERDSDKHPSSPLRAKPCSNPFCCGPWRPA